MHWRALLYLREWHTRSMRDRKEAQRNEGKWKSLVEKLAWNLVFWLDREFREIVFSQRVVGQIV